MLIYTCQMCVRYKNIRFTIYKYTALQNIQHSYFKFPIVVFIQLLNIGRQI